MFLAFFSFNRINNLSVFSVAHSSIPTALPAILFSNNNLAFCRGGKRRQQEPQAWHQGVERMDPCGVTCQSFTWLCSWSTGRLGRGPRPAAAHTYYSRPLALRFTITSAYSS